MRRVGTLSMLMAERRVLWLHCEKCFHMAKMPMPVVEHRIIVLKPREKRAEK